MDEIPVSNRARPIEPRKILTIVEDVKRCTLCANELPLNPNPILQVSATSRVLIVGQAPGIRVHETGLPFNDPSGDRLRHWLGVTREVFYDPKKFALLPMAFCYPGAGRSGDLPPPARCADTWRKRLLHELTDIRFTLLCGRYAINWHRPDTVGQLLTTIVKESGSRDTQVIATPHPSGRNNGWFAKNPWFDEDIVPRIRRRVRVALVS
ncbi:MAG: uracil-DNA glycosylase family protein [Gammaproteobacteria bacterium]|nr:uracil-DNA glycosylase family protein [Gammaproteobacteria bacterium]